MTSRSELLRRTRLGYLDRSLTLVAVDDSDMTSASEPWDDRASTDATDFRHVEPPGPTTATGLTGVSSLVHATYALGSFVSPQLPWSKNATVTSSFVSGNRSSK